MYLKWDEQSLPDLNQQKIETYYLQGYILGRVYRGQLCQNRSLRIDLNAFALNSENKRILRKTEAIHMHTHALPYDMYHWRIGKLGKDFYDQKFGAKTFSANKIKEALTDETQSNFNLLLSYSNDEDILGYAICHETNDMLHYSYPFYDLEQSPKNMGMGMMIRAIQYAKAQGKQYIYLGAAQRPTDTYKLQFKGLQWFDGDAWSEDLEELKNILRKI